LASPQFSPARWEAAVDRGPEHRRRGRLHVLRQLRRGRLHVLRLLVDDLLLGHAHAHAGAARARVAHPAHAAGAPALPPHALHVLVLRHRGQQAAEGCSEGCSEWLSGGGGEERGSAHVPYARGGITRMPPMMMPIRPSPYLTSGCLSSMSCEGWYDNQGGRRGCQVRRGRRMIGERLPNDMHGAA
jgi:hypothetical protein